MPISKSAKKALRVATRKTSLNRYRKALVKDAVKNMTAETAAKAISMIDKGAKWGLYHPNKASRMKAAIAKKAGGPIKSAKKAEAPKAAAKPAAKTAPKTKKTATKAKK
jgi:ribosomal protein S20